MKLSNIRSVGRFHNEATGQTVNVKKGRRVGRSDDFYFYLLRNKRQIIPASELSKAWVKVPETQDPKA